MARLQLLHAKRFVGFARTNYNLSLTNCSKVCIYAHKRSSLNFFRCASTDNQWTTNANANKSREFKLEDDNLKFALKLIFTQAVQSAYPLNSKEISLNVCSNPNLGDYQCNDAMQIFAAMKGKEGFEAKSPRDVAQNIIDFLPINPFFEKPSVAGPGFINVKISEEYIASRIHKFSNHELKSSKKNSELSSTQPNVIVDFSSPNIAKEMHVGHLRSTIIGDSLCRMLEYKKIPTLRLNHVGDWGTQFGMLIEYLNDEHDSLVEEIGDLQARYKLAKKRFDNDAEFKIRSQAAVVKLQSGDEKTLQVWKRICQTSRLEFQTIYEDLNVKIKERGESFYNSMIMEVLKELENKKIAVTSDGALCIFNEVAEAPLICRKSDGGFNYASTDLTAVYQRIMHEKADWIIYVTDNGQEKHFLRIFDAARRAGWLQKSDQPDVRLDHVGFGLVMGEDGKRFRTRSGDAIRLKDLLQESRSRCYNELKSRNNNKLSEIEMKSIAQKLGIGAIKYADLQNNLSTNYIFSFDRMLDLKGNTAVYLQYAHVRVLSVLDKTKVDIEGIELQQICIREKEERLLALHVLKFSEALDSALMDLMPSRICDYLYTLSTLFNDFYGSCRIIGNKYEGSRVILSYATAIIMRRCFFILGIEPIYRL